MTMRTCRAQRWTGKTAGLTLVELLVVLVIVCLSLGMVAFGLGAGQSERSLDGEAETLAAWIRGETARAVAHGSGRALRYDLDENTLSVREADEDAGLRPPELRHAVEAQVVMARVVLVRDGVEVAEHGSAQAMVMPGGTCEPHLVVLAAPDGGRRTLEVNPLTGDVTVFRGERDYGRIGEAEKAGGRPAGVHAD